VRSPQTYRILKYIMDSGGLNSIILTGDSILDTCYRSGHNINNNYGVL